MAKKQGNTITVQAGDSWAKIAGELYGDQRMFEELMRANKNISMLRPGQTLVLPQKRDNPYVSQFGAAATGMATEFNAQGQAMNAPGNPLVPQGTNVMSGYGMYQARKNAQEGGYQTSGASGVTAPASTTPAAPTVKPPVQQQQGVAGAGSASTVGSPTMAPLYGTPTPQPVTPPTAAGQFGVAGAGSVRPPTQQQPAAPQPGATGAAAIAGAAQAGQMVNIAGTGGQYSSGTQSGTFAPFTFFQGAQAQGPGSVKPPSTPGAPATAQQAAPTVAPAVGQPTVTPATAPLTGQAAAMQWAREKATTTYSQIDAALNGLGGTLPTKLHGSEIQNMAMAKGYSSQAIADALFNAGYVFDASTNSLVLPGSQTANYGGPNLGGNQGQAAALPEYRAPVYGGPQVNMIRGRRGQILRPSKGGGQAQEQQASLPMQLYNTISANWRI